MPAPPNRLPSAEDWIKRMRAWGVRPSKAKGQNFLLDAEVVARIADAAGAGNDDRILEIGPGLGILTGELLGRGATVTAIELDDTIAPRLEHHFRDDPRFRLIHDDATQVDPAGIYDRSKRYRIVANLPYSVATVIIRLFLESSHPPEELIVMVQREVAERMTATAGEMSLLTLAIQLYTDAEYLFTVPAEAFHPPPKVTSAVVRLRVRPQVALDALSRDRLFELATIAFQQKRKTLLNSLARGLDMDKATLADRLGAVSVDGSLRPQALTFDDWLRLARANLHRP